LLCFVDAVAGSHNETVREVRVASVSAG
jgi:hypothetical protein